MEILYLVGHADHWLKGRNSDVNSQLPLIGWLFSIPLMVLCTIWRSYFIFVSVRFVREEGDNGID